MTTTAWLFMGAAFAIIAGAAFISLKKILSNNK